MSAQLIVCGSAGSHPGPDAAGASVLLSAGTTDVLLDIGNGSLTNLMQFRDVADIDAVVLSHMHPDHFLDIYGFHHARKYHPNPDLPPVPVYAPPGGVQTVAPLVDAIDSFTERLPFHDHRTGTPFTVGPLQFTPFGVTHLIEAYGFRITGPGVNVAYTGDAAFTDDLVDNCRDADLLIADTTWAEADGPFPPGIHMTAAEVGRLAEAAGVARVLLTHIKPTTDPAIAAAEAGNAFRGQVIVSRDRLELTL